MSVCYRHPEIEAYVRCQRCERFICPKCQVSAPVGFLCPEDSGQTISAAAAGAATSARVMVRSATRRALVSAMPVTWALIAINVVVWVLQLSFKNLTFSLVFSPIAATLEPWRMITAGFAHDESNPLHLLLNMYSLFILGRALEELLGSWRFSVVYLLSLFAGSLGFLAFAELNSYELGASGAIFGLMGAYFVIVRALGGQLGQVGGIIAINLVFGFVVPGVAWQAHVGGLIAGALVATIYARTRASSQRNAQIALLATLALLLVGLAYLVAQYRLHQFLGF